MTITTITGGSMASIAMAITRCQLGTASTTLAWRETVTSGEIRIGERVVNDVEPSERDIAMVFQNYALYPHMRVYDNMA